MHFFKNRRKKTCLFLTGMVYYSSYFDLEKETHMNKLTSYIANLLVPANFLPYRIVSITLIVLMGIAALAAIVLVMLQPGNSQGIDALGGSSETFYGKNKGRSIESKLKMWTLICLGVLAVLAVVFFILQIEAIWGV